MRGPRVCYDPDDNLPSADQLAQESRAMAWAFWIGAAIGAAIFAALCWLIIFISELSK